MILKIGVMLLFFCFIQKQTLAATCCNELEDKLNTGFRNYFKIGKFHKLFLETLVKTKMKKLTSSVAQNSIGNQLLCTSCPLLLDILLEELNKGTHTSILVEFAKDVCKVLHIQAIDSICDDTVDLYSGSNTPLKVLQITDIHYDSLYKAGSNAKCDSPMCCNLDGGNLTSPEDAAGYWTDYRNCDIPLRTIDATLDYISSEHKDLDYVYFTGDIVSHHFWTANIESNTNDIITVLDRFGKTFGDIPVYPIIGNHEVHPINIWTPENITEADLSTQWLFDLLAVQWSKWLPADTYETIVQGGFYTVLIRPGLRLIALNSNVAYILNWWLLYDDVDPYGQLQWMENVLYAAERDGESVHIISHVPSGDSTCYIIWAKNFRKVVERYSSTITAIFNGHTHFDELIVYYETDEAISVAWNGGSLTPYYNLNPNYRIYSVDSGNFDVIDFDQYTFNLTEANLNPSKPPAWYHLYSFKQEYGLDDLSPASVSNLTSKMTNDHSLLEKYYKNKVRNADPYMQQGCDEKCQKANLCAMVTSSYDDTSKCDELVKQWNSTIT